MTIVDIAKESGYSVTTVSRVLNNRQDVSPAAKETIMKIVEAHNFVPNTNAKRLKQTISRNIYLLVKGTSNMLFANVVEEIQSIIDRTDYSLSITYLDEDSNLSSVTDRICRERKPLGIIFLGGSREDFSEDTSSFKVPCVIVTTSAENWSMEELSSVSIDDEKAGETIVDYLIEHGHTKIAEIGANLELSQTARLRHNGYLNSLKKHGITPDERYYERARFSYDSAYRAMKKLLEKDIEITAVYAISDVMAIGALRALQRNRGEDYYKSIILSELGILHNEKRNFKRLTNIFLHLYLLHQLVLIYFLNIFEKVVSYVISIKWTLHGII